MFLGTWYGTVTYACNFTYLNNGQHRYTSQNKIVLFLIAGDTNVKIPFAEGWNSLQPFSLFRLLATLEMPNMSSWKITLDPQRFSH